MSDFDPTNRELCADGACIGVIGRDGTCRECGAVARSETTHSRLRGMRTTDSDTETELEPSTDDSDRKLCSDDMCVGIIGLDGRCKECGLSAAGAAAVVDDDDDDAAEDDYAEDDDDDDEADSEDRELCPDDMCIGLIGANGRCKECGTVAN